MATFRMGTGSANTVKTAVRRFGSVAALVGALGACDGDAGTTPEGDTSGADVGVATGTSQVAKPAGVRFCTSGSDTKSAVTCVETAVSVDPVTPDAGCDPAQIIGLDGGLGYPWGGANVTGRSGAAKSFTCNGCPNGLPELQGRWRAHGFVEDSDEPDYRYPDAKTDLATVLFVDGNTFYAAEADARDGSSWQSRGFYFCGMKPESSGKHIYWADLDDNGAIVNWTRTDPILTSGSDNLLITYFNSLIDVSVTTSVSYGYCRIGSSRGGQVCNSPFLD
jgi:hypothetical protein